MTNSNTRLAFVLAAAPTLAFVLHDFVFQLPDNEGDVTTGFLLTAAGLLCLWAASGYIAARVPRTSAAAIGAGALMAAISVAMVWLAFVVLNGAFIERMSYEPDRIRAFQRSGYPTLQEWWHHQRDCGPFPIVMSVAAGVGAFGGLMQRLVSPVQRLLWRPSR